MDWILHCFLLISMISAYSSKQHSGVPFYPQYHDDGPDYSEDYKQYEFESYRPGHHNPQIRRVDHENYETQTRERINERSAERPMNERSIAVNSGIQRVQDEERRRLQSRIDDAAPRTENGTYKIVNNYPKTYPSVMNRRGEIDAQSMRDTVIFPGPTSKSSDYVPDIPQECLKIGICDNVPNYPTELAASIIAQLGEKRKIFQQIDELDAPEIAQRIGPADQNIELCDFREKIVMPEAAPDKNGEWYFILNKKDEPLQGYRVEVCNRDGISCNQNIAYFHTGYTATCKQKFVQRTMTAIDKAGNVKHNMAFKVPSCCSCVASHTGKK